MQYNQNYRYQRCLFFKRFKIGCQSPYTKKIGERYNAIRLERKRNELYIQFLPGALFVRPAEPMSERSIIPCLLVAIVGNTRGVNQATPSRTALDAIWGRRNMRIQDQRIF